MDFSGVKSYFLDKTTTQWILFAITILAIIEWIAFMVVNLKTFLNVLKNPDSTTGSGRTVFVIAIYVVVRCMFIPFYIAGLTIDLPVYAAYQPILYKISTVILTVWWNLVILLPCVTVWYSRLRYGIGNNVIGQTTKEYNFIIILPVYNETLDLLVEGVESMLKSNYPAHLMQIHVAFDNDEFSKLYLEFADYFKLDIIESNTSVSTIVNGVTVWVHRFPHSGKRLTQSRAWDFVKNSCINKTQIDNTILLFTDSDNYMYNNALQNLAYNFERCQEKLAFAGYMTCMSSGWGVLNPYRLLQDTEYVGGEMNRAFELLMGTVNCLPGGFTAMRYSAFDSVADKYFTTLSDDTITDYHRNYLGEDRYLTHIMHQYLPRHSMGFCPSARCKTDPPTTLNKLVMQRRRWYLGAMSNEAYMFTDKLIWKKYKAMIIYKLVQLCLWRSFSISQFILAILMFNGMDFSSWSGMSNQILAMVIPLTLSWILISITGIKLGHYKVIFVYPFSHIPQTIIALLVDWKVVATLEQRSWGGARMQQTTHIDANNIV